MQIFNLSVEELNEYANQVKDAILQDLNYDGLISDKKFKELSKTKIITNVKLNMISAFFKRLIKKAPSVGDLRIVVCTAKMLKDEFEEQPIKQEEVREALKKE